MSPTFWLLQDLQNKLQDGFIKYPFKTEKDGELCVTPSVYIGHVPLKEADKDNGNVPYIIIKSLSGVIKSTEKGQRIYEVKIAFFCHTYNNDCFSEIEAGYNDILNMVERVLIILNDNHFYADDNWKYIEPVIWTTGAEKETGLYEQGTQKHPFYGAVVEATFNTQAIERLRFSKLMGEE